MGGSGAWEAEESGSVGGPESGSVGGRGERERLKSRRRGYDVTPSAFADMEREAGGGTSHPPAGVPVQRNAIGALRRLALNKGRGAPLHGAQARVEPYMLERSRVPAHYSTMWCSGACEFRQT